MTLRSLAALSLLLVAPAALAAGPQSLPDWAAPAAPAAPAGTAAMGGGPPDPPPPPPAVPLDGGLSLLALAGAGYATKKLRARRAN
ncbi:MAG TPA: hypothetical protein VF576_04685 [Rubricoccaceae bacterium]|jgi:hypothetical protein